MLYAGPRWIVRPLETRLGPLRTGFFYGIVAVVVAFVVGFRFLYLDPADTTDWVLAAAESFLPLVAAASVLFFGILAAIRVRPVRAEPGVPYRSILLRDCTLAATVVAVLAGLALLVLTALHATVFADAVRGYAADAAPKIASYVNETGRELEEPPPPTTAAEVERNLQPPEVRDLGRSLFNLVLRALLLGVLGAVVGLIRGFANRRNAPDSTPRDGGNGKTPNP